MSGYERLLRPLLFRLDAEMAHNLALRWIASGLVRSRLVRDGRLHTSAMGIFFENPIGLAAGLDKNAIALSRWPMLGFGFAEVGTVTLHAQTGNPKPRLFRLPADEAIINRMGFNNVGAHAMTMRLTRRTKAGYPLGINIGKSKVTPLSEAATEYKNIYELVWKHADYVVVNVSSPNTPDLRGLQEKEALSEILAAIRSVQQAGRLLVKISPDLTVGALEDIVEVGWKHRITGIIATNTTTSREGLRSDVGEDGGLSGKPLKPLADANLSLLGEMLKGEMTLIGVGGVFSASDVLDKLRLGASLVQLYTGWVYGGPGTVPRILLDLLAIMDREGARSLTELSLA